MITTFKPVRELFNRVYQQALTEKGQEVMASQKTGYLAPTRLYLALIKSVGLEIHDRKVDSVIGPKKQPPVAFVMDPSGLGLVQINQGVSEDKLIVLAKKYYEL